MTWFRLLGNIETFEMDTYYKLFPDLVEKIHLDLGIFFLPETRIYITQIWVITICVVLDHNTVIFHIKITGMQDSNQGRQN